MATVAFPKYCDFLILYYNYLMGSERFKKTNLTRREFFLRSSAAVAGGITVGAVDVATEPFLLIDAFSSPERGKKTNENTKYH